MLSAWDWEHWEHWEPRLQSMSAEPCAPGTDTGEGKAMTDAQIQDGRLSVPCPPKALSWDKGSQPAAASPFILGVAGGQSPLEQPHAHTSTGRAVQRLVGLKESDSRTKRDLQLVCAAASGPAPASSRTLLHSPGR